MDLSALINMEMCEENTEHNDNQFNVLDLNSRGLNPFAPLDSLSNVNSHHMGTIPIYPLIPDVGGPSEYADTVFMNLDTMVAGSSNQEDPTETYDFGPDEPVRFGIQDVYSIPPLNPYTTEPPYDLFWPEEQLSKTPVSSPELLHPPPATTPPAGSGFIYPNAPSYTLVQDNRYRRGYTYVADFNPAQKSMVMEKLLHTIIPPDIGPRVVDGKLTYDPIPGMILMPVGIPFVNRINGSDQHIITVACIQTVSSMQQYPCGPEVSRLADEVLEIAFGKPGVDGQPAVPAIYDLGLKHNNRSTKDVSDPRNGSSSLATTKIEGDGRGVVAPAVQIQHPQICRLLRICYLLFRLIMPTCISKLEWDMFEWIYLENNVPGFGGPLPNNTGLQVNVSSDIGDLASMIGQIQGRLHTDRNDFHPGFTLFILAIRLPPGSDSGPFFFPRPALYFRAIGIALFFAVFKGPDLHGGEKPTVNPDPVTAEQWLAQTGLGQLADLVGMQNRVGIVLYPNHAAFTRVTPFLITPVTGFGNMGSQSHFNRGYPTFANDGLPIFGDIETHKNFLARDIVFNAWNTGLLGDISPTHPAKMLSDMTYTNERGETCKMAPLPYDPVKDSSLVRRMRGYYSWYVQTICQEHYIPITKTAYGRTQQRLRESYKHSLESSHARPPILPNVRLPIKARHAMAGDQQSTADPVASSSVLSTVLPPPSESVMDTNFEEPIVPIRRSKRKALALARETDEIESIQEVATLDGIPQWRVRFKGCGPADDLWYEYEAIARDAGRLLKEFQLNSQDRIVSLANLVFSAELSDEGTSEGDGDWEDNNDPDPEPSSSSIAASSMMPVVLPFLAPVPYTSFKMLDMLLDAARLQQEAVALEAGRNFVGKPLDSKTLVQLLQARLDLDNQVTAFMELLPESKDKHGIYNEEAMLLLEQIIGSVNILPTLVVESEKLHFLQRAIQWQMCRSYLVFFQWYSDIGPRLARQMAHCHQLSNIEATFPSFVNCINHVVQYVTCVRTQQQNGFHHKAKRRKTSAQNTNLPGPDSELNEEFARLSIISSHFVDTRIDPSSSGIIILPVVNRTVTNNDEGLYAMVSEVLFALWCDALIVPSLDRVDDIFNTSRRRKNPNNSTHRKNVIDRSIVRGGIVMALVDTVGEGILASNGIHNFLSSPARMFAKKVQKDDAFASKLLRDYATAMEPLITHVQALLDSNSKIEEWCDYIGGLVSGALVDLGDRTLSALPSGASKQSRANKKSVLRSPLNPALPVQKLEDILTDSKAPHFGALGLICREALSAGRNKGVQHLDLSRVLLGQTKPKYQQTHTLNQTYPFPHTSPYATLFAKHLPANKLTGCLGLANMLVFMVSSQCEDTVKFLDDVTFWSDTLEECIEMFDQIVRRNSHFYTDLHYNPISPASSGTGKPKKKTGFHALDRREQAASGYIHLDSPTIWGQPSSQLSLFPDVPHRDHLVKRFTELFSNAFQNKWTKFLGPLVGIDPASRPENLPTWNDMHQFIHKLGVTGLGSITQPTLTAFQLTNNLAFAGICTPPLVENVTAWIWKMKKAGAYRGLQELGFNVTSLHRTHMSFNCVFRHFDDNLSVRDRSSMGFDIGCGVIFVEHILCKVVRWQSRLAFNCGKKASLIGLGDAVVEREIQWTKGANYNDASLFPIPLTMSTERLTELLISVPSS